MSYTYEDPQYVQTFLDMLQPMQRFVVVFEKQNGEQRRYTGNLDPEAKQKSQSVAMQTDEGWKRSSGGS